MPADYDGDGVTDVAYWNYGYVSPRPYDFRTATLRFLTPLFYLDDCVAHTAELRPSPARSREMIER